MPQKCLTCDFIGRTDENPDCLQRGECRFEQVRTYHYAKPDGQGKLVGRVQSDTGELVELRLSCETADTEAVGIPYLPSVTCLTCLANNPKKEE